jgi:hypothetical protein
MNVLDRSPLIALFRLTPLWYNKFSKAQAAGPYEPSHEVQNMDETGWFILIYQTADADSQARLAAGLHCLGRMVVGTEEDSDDYFVVVECEDTTPAITLHELVMSFDETAVLSGSHGPFAASGAPDGDIRLGVPRSRTWTNNERQVSP